MPLRPLALTTLVLLAAAAQAQDQVYAVTGRAVDAETGAPVALASVAPWRVSAREGVEPYLETGAVSDDAGRFRVDRRRGRPPLPGGRTGARVRLGPGPPPVDRGRDVAAGLGADAFGWGDLDLQSTVSYRALRDTEQGRMGARLFFDVGVRERLLDGRASLSVRARDPFGIAGLAFVQDDAVLYQEVSRSFGRREVGLTFTYTFGVTERRERTERVGAADEGLGDGGLEL